MTETQTAANTTDRDLTCPACGYNLRGLPDEARCPECATPIAEALRGPLGGTSWRTIGRLDLGIRLSLGLLLLNFVATYVLDTVLYVALVHAAVMAALCAIAVVAAVLVGSPELRLAPVHGTATGSVAGALRTAAAGLGASAGLIALAVPMNPGDGLIVALNVIALVCLAAINLLLFVRLGSIAAALGEAGLVWPFRAGGAVLAAVVGEQALSIGRYSMLDMTPGLGWDISRALSPWLVTMAALVLAGCAGGLRHAIKSALGEATARSTTRATPPPAPGGRGSG